MGTFVNNTKAGIKLFLQKCAKRAPGPVRVVFVCQYIPAWNKAKSVYDQMVADPRFEPYLLCLPDRITDMQLRDPENLENDIYEYYVNQDYPAINALVGKDQWYDLQALQPDFVFYLRPYDFYMPAQYASSVVSRYAKVCVILYGIIITQEDADLLILPQFFRNVAYYFAEIPYAARFNRKLFPLSHLLGLRKSPCCGIPAMDSILTAKDTPSDAWDFAGHRLRILWTPRWTTDKALGGSNFFTYKDWILDYAKKNDNVACLLRPHPLTFDNFIRTGEMTAAEVADYKAQCAAIANADMDTRKEYGSTFWQSDVLISDYSGILPEYFITGKPLIFCRSNFSLAPTDFMEQMMEGWYVVDNVTQLEEVLAMLQRGEDPLQPTRQALIQKLFGDRSDAPAKKIVDILLK